MSKELHKIEKLAQTYNDGKLWYEMRKIARIKAARQYLNVGLKEAHEFVMDQFPDNGHGILVKLPFIQLYVMGKIVFTIK